MPLALLGLAVPVIGLLSWVAYLTFLYLSVKRHGPDVLKHIPGAVKAYRTAGALAWADALTTYLRARRGGS